MMMPYQFQFEQMMSAESVKQSFHSFFNTGMAKCLKQYFFYYSDGYLDLSIDKINSIGDLYKYLF